MLCVETAEGDVIRRIHHHRDDVMLANPHERLQTVALLRKQFCLEHFGRKVLIENKIAQRIKNKFIFIANYH